MCSDTRTDVHADPHIEKSVHIYNNSHLKYCGNDEKNRRFYNNQFGSYNPNRNNLLQYKETYKWFIDFVWRVN